MSLEDRIDALIKALDRNTNTLLRSMNSQEAEPPKAEAPKAEPETPKAEPANAEPETPAGDVPSLDDMKKAVLEGAKVDRNATVETLGRYGAKKATDVAEGDRAACIEELRRIYDDK